jgi:hypothetical protein
MKEVAGEGACTVDPTNVSAIREAIVRAIEEPAYRDAVVSAGTENAKRYNAAEVAASYAELYERVSTACR